MERARLSRLQRTLFLFVWASIFCSALNFVHRFFWWQAANQDLWVYYLALHLGAIALLWSWARRTVVVLAALSLLYLWPLLPYFRGSEPAVDFGPAHTLLLHYVEGPEALEDERADVLIVSHEGPVPADAALNARYPFAARSTRGGARNFSVYSKYELRNVQTSVGDDLPPVFAAAMVMPDGQVFHAGVLPLLRPVSRESVHQNDVLVRRYGNMFRYLDEPTVILGRFHASHLSPVYRIFRKVSRTADADEGRGLPLTWDFNGVLPFFPSRHVFSKGGCRAVSEGEMVRVSFPQASTRAGSAPQGAGPVP